MHVYCFFGAIPDSKGCTLNPPHPSCQISSFFLAAVTKMLLTLWNSSLCGKDTGSKQEIDLQDNQEPLLYMFRSLALIIY